MAVTPLDGGAPLRRLGSGPSALAPASLASRRCGIAERESRAAPLGGQLFQKGVGVGVGHPRAGLVLSGLESGQHLAREPLSPDALLGRGPFEGVGVGDGGGTHVWLQDPAGPPGRALRRLEPPRRRRAAPEGLAAYDVLPGAEDTFELLVWAPAGGQGGAGGQGRAAPPAGGPTTTARGPTTAAGGPTTTAGGPITTAGGPITTERGSTTTERGPTTTERGPATTERGPATTERGPATTERGPATTERGPAASTEAACPTPPPPPDAEALLRLSLASPFSLSPSTLSGPREAVRVVVTGEAWEGSARVGAASVALPPAFPGSPASRAVPLRSTYPFAARVRGAALTGGGVALDDRSLLHLCESGHSMCLLTLNDSSGLGAALGRLGLGLVPGPAAAGGVPPGVFVGAGAPLAESWAEGVVEAVLDLDCAHLWDCAARVIGLHLDHAMPEAPARPPPHPPRGGRARRPRRRAWS